MRRRESYYGRRRYKWGVGALLAGVLLIGGCGACGVAYYGEDPVTIEVEGKESVSTDSGHEYRVYTDKGTYVISDSIFKTRFASADDYRNLKEGKTYDCDAFGWRVPLFSMFKNLIDCKEAAS